MTYRNIFFKKGIIQNFSGNVDVYYTGCMYANCDSMKNFTLKFDRNKDLLINCNDCASRKYRKFIKITEKK